MRENRVAKKKTIVSIQEKKARKERIVALTAYDYPSALLVDRAGVDLALVGDSLGMVIQGESSTLPVTLDDVVYHSRCASRGIEHALLVADMPFGTATISPPDAVRAAVRLVQEGKAEAVKIEGGRNRLPAIRAVLEADIPVMGHVGLLPQSVRRMGGYKIQGKVADGASQILEDAEALQEAGCFALIAEGIPHPVGRLLTTRLRIPVIGIGAGPYCDGQILVFHDMLGLMPEEAYRFVRLYARLGEVVTEAIQKYAVDVRSGDFPSLEESFGLDAAEQEELERRYGNHLQDQ